MTGNKRQRPRIEINHIINYAPDNKAPDNHPEDALLINISTTGALIETREEVPKTPVIVGNNSKTNPLFISGEAVHTDVIISPDRESFGMFRTGIRFTDTHEKTKAFVISIVKHEEHGSSAKTESISAEEAYRLPVFDTGSIHSILDDDAPTAAELDLDFFIDNDDQEGDALDDISQILEKTLKKNEPIAEPVATPSIKNPDIVSTPLPEPDFDIEITPHPFFRRLNTACFSLLVLSVIGLMVFLFLSPETQNRDIVTQFSQSPPKPSVDFDILTDVKGLISGSVKGEFSDKGDTSSQFIISGIAYISDTTGEALTVTARLYDSDGLLTDKQKTRVVFTDPENISPQSNTGSGILKHRPFTIAFNQPTNKISGFSIDID